MKPAPFKYIATRSLEEALALKAEHGDDARFLAGGQSLMPAMNFRLAQPRMLIDINALASLEGVQWLNRSITRIGALTRYRTLQRDRIIAEHQPLLHQTIPHIAHPQIRNRGTIGGNLAHADPASELPAVMLALGGLMRAQSVAGERWIAAQDFFVGSLTTALRPDEMLIEIELPRLPPGTGTCFLEVARRRGDFALMGVAATMTLRADGVCSAAQLAYCSAGDRPMSVAAAARVLIGCRPSEAEFREAAALAHRSLEPIGNIHASSSYQRHLAGILTRRALLRAAQVASSASGAQATTTILGHGH